MLIPPVIQKFSRLLRKSPSSNVYYEWKEGVFTLPLSIWKGLKMNVYVGEGLAVFVFIIFDVISGLCNAVYHGDLSSKKMRQGLMHKFSYVLVLFLSYAMELGQNYTGVRIDFPLITTVVAFICISEILSVFENCCEMNPELRKSKIADLFDLTNKNDEDKMN